MTIRATLFLIVGIHAAAFCGLLTTLSYTHGLTAQPKLQNHVLPPVPVQIKIVAIN